MSRLVLTVILSLQFSLAGAATNDCAGFFSSELQASDAKTTKENLCVVGASAIGDLKESLYVGETEHEIYGSIRVYSNPENLMSLAVVSDDLAVMFDSENQIVPFIVAVVATDLGIITAWMLTDMYSRKPAGK